jgi:MFS family permease
MKNKFIWSIILILGVAQFLLVVDTTIMNVSISNLVNDLNTSVQGVQTAISLYALVMAVFMMMGAKLGDIWGNKKTFIIGIVLFGIGAFIASISQNLWTLIIGWSIIEGLGAALLMPSLQVLTRFNYEGKQRTMCYGILGAIAAFGVAFGPIVGGFLTTYYSWRWAFRLEVLIVILVMFFLHLLKDSPKKKGLKLDVGGVLLSIFSLGSIVYGVLLSSTYGWLSARQPLVVGDVTIDLFGLSVVPFLILFGLIFLFLLFLWEKKVSKNGKLPLFNFDILKNKGFSSGLSITVVQYFIQGAIFFCIPLFLQVVLGYDALKSGIALLPISISILLFSLLGAKLAQKLYPKHIILAGLGLVILGGFLLMGSISDLASIESISFGLAFIGAGIGLISSQVVNFNLSMVKESEVNDASGLNGTLQQFGMSLGTAIAGSVLIIGLSFSAISQVNQDPNLTSSQKDIINEKILEKAQFVSNADITSVMSENNVPENIQQEVVKINDNARISALKGTVLMAVIVGFFSLILAKALPRKKVN